MWYFPVNREGTGYQIFNLGILQVVMNSSIIEMVTDTTMDTSCLVCGGGSTTLGDILFANGLELVAGWSMYSSWHLIAYQLWLTAV